MKLKFLAIAILFASNLAGASTLKCRFNHLAMDGSGFKASAAAGKYSEADCNDGAYRVTVAGLGLHFLAPLGELFTVKCTNQDPVGNYFGINAEVATILGADLGAFAGSKGVCSLVGTQVGLGAGVIGGLLRVQAKTQK
jgi:hypothetical protein